MLVKIRLEKNSHVHLERTEFSMFKNSMNDSEEKIMKHFQQKIIIPQYPVLEEHFKQNIPTFRL